MTIYYYIISYLSKFGSRYISYSVEWILWENWNWSS